MQVLDYTHNQGLVAASFFVALVAGFTGLSLTKGLSARSFAQRKLAIALSAVALGGGIWSMHFVAMLGLQLPIQFYYDSAVTLASALVAILVVGTALLILHFWQRTRMTVALAGTTVGLGVLAMHYIGMAGLELCRALYTPGGIALAVSASCVLNTAAFSIAYGERSHRNILLGTAGFGLAVFTVHFIAIAGTSFTPLEAASQVGPLIGKETLAIGVVLTSFALCGAFLLTGVTFLKPSSPIAQPALDSAPPPAAGAEPEAEPAPVSRQIPYEQEGRTQFFSADAVAAIRAEGHYTHLYTAAGQHFCSWSITEAERRLAQTDFIKSHRSYLINPAHVSGFERLKDNGVCHFDIPGLAKVPVSRSRLKVVRAALGV
ncbi:MHYT domain-containing protein [Leisingera sp. D0M16]|uniref:MHYT domain-containing protein n=1 Tax=Leisingera coralii TaxID=3351347 RepID=UPI003B7C1F68